MPHLDRRLALWEAGNFQELLSEGETIQKQMLISKKAVTETTLAKRFATMVFNNNFKGAMGLITDKGKGCGLLKVSEKVKKDMQSKHPHAEPADPAALLTGPLPPSVDPIFYDALDAELMKKCALRTHGGAGISQQEDVLWHKMVTSYQQPSTSTLTA